MPEPLDTGFDLLPPEPDEGSLTPDQVLDLALAEDAEDDADLQPEPYGRGWAFDFLRGRFVRHGQSPANVRGLDQLRVWVEKALRTARFAHPVYGEDYGAEISDDLIGTPFTPGAAALQEDAITDALSVHDRITDVSDFDYQVEDDALLVSFTITVDDTEGLDFNISFGGDF